MAVGDEAGIGIELELYGAAGTLARVFFWHELSLKQPASHNVRRRNWAQLDMLARIGSCFIEEAYACRAD